MSLQPSTPEGFRLAHDGRQDGKSYITAHTTASAFDIPSGKYTRSERHDRLFRPIPRPDGSLIDMNYAGKDWPCAAAAQVRTTLERWNSSARG